MKRVLVISLLVIGFYILKTFYQAGQFKDLENFFQGEVEAIYTNVPGPEDMEVDYNSGMVFISGSNRRPGNASANGIYLLDLNTTTKPFILENDYKGDFNPHGLSLFYVDSALYLFVVNHNDSGDFIEKFLYEDGQLYHKESYSYSEMCCPNDIVAVAANKFYVSNDHGAKGGIMRLIEDYIRIPRGSVFYYNGVEFSEAARPFYYANGINVSPDRKTLYLAETTGSSISSFLINEDGTLDPKATLDLGTGLDNIDVDENGDLWVAAHPKLIDFVEHAKDSLLTAPSQVIKLIPKPDYQFEIKQVYMNDGAQLSASSIAVRYKDHLIMGGVLNWIVLRTRLENHAD